MKELENVWIAKDCFSLIIELKSGKQIKTHIFAKNI
jgi:hypothetical protein